MCHGLYTVYFLCLPMHIFLSMHSEFVDPSLDYKKMLVNDNPKTEKHSPCPEIMENILGVERAKPKGKGEGTWPTGRNCKYGLQF